ncbi:MAG: transposase [bacterium]|nr:transposase [bacterium]
MSALPEWIDLPTRKPTRHPAHDYDSACGYHVVICVKDMALLFGKVVEGRMELNYIGRMVAASIQHHFFRYAGVELKTCGIMPNHLHLLVLLHDSNLSGRTIGLTHIIQRFKSYTATSYLKWRKESDAQQLPWKLWQDSFWDRVIRSEEDLLRTWEYIENNPLAWNLARKEQLG